MPQKSPVINLCRLHLNIQSPADNSGDRALLSLDTHRAFNSKERQYLRAMMGKFGFGDISLSWVELSYDATEATIREARQISQPFPLHRGTRQGCPCPLSFCNCHRAISSYDLLKLQYRWIPICKVT